MLNREDFKENSSDIINWIDKYFNNLESFPVKSLVSPKEIYNKIPADPPENAESMDDILKDMDDIIVPGITHWQHPNYHAYFNANSSVESVYAEMITAAIGAQCMIWETSPAAAELEERMAEWLRKAMGLPEYMEGVIQDSASSATLTAILTAREVKTEFKSNIEGVPSNLRVYCSNQTHSSVDKAVGISGIGKKNLIKVPVDESLSIIPSELEKRIKEDIENSKIPCCVIVSIGTTGTVAVDSLKEIGEICEKYNIFLHVDAAYAGTALLLPEYRWMSEGIENADSFVFNPHKWMFTNFDCSMYYVKSVEALIKTFDILPEYLKTKTRGLVNDYRDWGIPLGRRFRALKLWFVIRGFGIKGLQERIRHHIQLNEYFSSEINKSENFELVLKPFLNFTCFRFKPKGVDDTETLNRFNEKLLHRINSSGEIFISHTKIEDKYVIRFLVGQTYIEKYHINKALETIKKFSDEL